MADGCGKSHNHPHVQSRGTLVRLAGKVLGGVLLAAAVYLAVETVRQSLKADDGGPAAGALGMGCPAAILLIAAGAVWETTQKK